MHVLPVLERGCTACVLQEARSKVAYVLPAFETYGIHHEAAALADLLVSRDKVRSHTCYVPSLCFSIHGSLRISVA